MALVYLLNTTKGGVELILFTPLTTFLSHAGAQVSPKAWLENGHMKRKKRAHETELVFKIRYTWPKCGLIYLPALLLAETDPPYQARKHRTRPFNNESQLAMFEGNLYLMQCKK